MSNDLVVKRFTYDWLIRFAELHPFQYFDFDTGIRAVHLPFHWHRLKYASISPLFNTLIQRHMPYLVNADLITFEDGEITQPREPLQKDRCSILGGEYCSLYNLTPGCISKFKEKRIYFYGRTFTFTYNYWRETGCTLTPAEFQYLLKYSDHSKLFNFYGALTEPMMFSEIWPQVVNCEYLRLRIKNLIYGENLASVLRENRVLPTKGCDLLDMDVSDKAVVDILDAVVALPLRPPSFEIHFEEKRTKSLREAIVDKFKDAADFHGALTFNLITVSTCKNQISFSFANALS